MPLITKAYTFQNGVASDAIQVNQDMDTLYNLLNGLLDAMNIANNGLNDPNKFAAEVITQAKSKGLVYTQDLYGQSWVVSGGVTTASGSPANQITVTTLIANILQADGSYRHVSVGGATYVTSIINATYYLELQPDGTMNWSQTHSVQANYMPIATVTSNASGNINVITDTRVTGLTLRTPAKTPNNTLDDGTGIASFNGSALGQITIAAGSANNHAALQMKALGTGYPNISLQSGAVEQWQIGSDPLSSGRYYLYSNSIAANSGMALTIDKTTGNVNMVGALTAGSATINGALTAGAGGSFANSKNTNGYQKLPGGLIMQWGFILSVANSSTAITSFPVAFPAACVSLVGTHTANGNTVSVFSLSTTSYAFYCTGATAGTQVYWQAFGY